MFRSPKMKSLKSNMFLKKTMKLSNKDKIGAGGYGTVYRLRIDDTMSFAVKRLNRGTAEQDRGFERELDAMGDIKHRNIVALHGYYTATNYNLLIYELMANGSLDTLLHGKSTDKVLDWPTRYKIAVGAARGIAYLHHDCIPHIIHRDIKSSNILLDENMEARVSDFGLATLMEPDKTHVSTLVAGTFGYLAPEYFDTGRATVKGDVYSFGVVLLELLTGKRPTDEAFIEEGTKLVTWVKVVVQEKKEEYVTDSCLECFPSEEINAVFSIALTCLESDPTKRPTMAEVLKMLERIKPDVLVSEIDYNLYGMGHPHVSKIKFRLPVPDVISCRKARDSRQHRQQTDNTNCLAADFLADSSGNACLDSPIWISSTIPDGWIWQQPSQLDLPTDPDIHIVTRQSTCQLEGDASVDGALYNGVTLILPIYIKLNER